MLGLALVRKYSMHITKASRKILGVANILGLYPTVPHPHSKPLYKFWGVANIFACTPQPPCINHVWEKTLEW